MSGLRPAVASGHPVTTEAAREVLHAGGNAFDAVVAAGFASAVVEPMLTSLAGGGFVLTRTHAGETSMVDFFVDVPGQGRDGTRPSMRTVQVAFSAATQEFHAGWASVAVPGCLAGWLHVHETRGRLPLARVLEPAVRACEGVTVNHQQAYLFQILAPITGHHPDARDRFSPGGSPLAVGDVLRQPDVGAYLARLGSDPEGGRQEFDEALVAACRDDGIVTAADLRAYEVRESAPLEAEYRGRPLLTNDAPGGRLVAAQLAALADLPPLGGLEDADGPSHVVSAQLEADRRRERMATQGTTHVSVADAEGNVATMTTSNGTGSGCPIPGLGILANNMLGEDDLFPDGLGTGVPGERVSSMMSPTVLLERDRVSVALGSGGSKRIRTALTQVVARLVDHAEHLDEAVSFPRVHHDGEVVQAEPGLSEAAYRQLASTYRLNRWQSTDLYFGGVHAARPDGRTSDEPPAEAAGDARRGGAAAVG